MSKQSKSLDEEFVEFNIPAVDANGKELSKSARKKLLTKAKKEARKKADAKKQENTTKKIEEKDTSEGNYGVRDLIQSKGEKTSEKEFIKISTLDSESAGKSVLFRARIHNIRPQAKIVFLVLRQQFHTIQAVCLKENCSKQMLNFIGNQFSESVVDVRGKLVKPDENIKSATQGDIELHVTHFHVVSSALQTLPMHISDAERPLPVIQQQKKEIAAIDAKLDVVREELKQATDEEKKKELTTKVDDLLKEKDEATKFVILGKPTRLDNRYIDLRTTTNQAILKIKSGVCQLFREFLYSHGFMEIQTPKLIGTASEGGAEVFKLDYFGKKAFLAQSPQLYKQMAISSDCNRVFEVGPVFRAENANTPRHMTEFIGLDLEMAFNEHYHEVMELMDDLFVYIFDNLNKRFAVEIARVKAQYPCEDLKYRKKSLRLKWPEAIALLRENGIEIGDLEDFSLEIEKTLGNLVAEKYGTDFFMLDKFPLHIRPFYTMPCPEDENYSNSYDFFIRGQEIVSGAQRIHDPELLLKQAKKHEVDLEKIADYIDCFKYGSFPHAGCGIGLERVVMLFLGLPTVQYVSMFPRTPHRLRP